VPALLLPERGDQPVEVLLQARPVRLRLRVAAERVLPDVRPPSAEVDVIRLLRGEPVERLLQLFVGDRIDPGRQQRERGEVGVLVRFGARQT
jgi:hypothetical protein